MELPLLYNDIIKLLPHRYPFLLVDKVTDIEMGKNIVGYKNVTVNEHFFQGHFPDNPIMPGVLIIEAMAQMGGILARLTIQGEQEVENRDAVYFMSIDKVKFRKPVVPGDQLRFEVQTLRAGSKVWKLAGKAFVGESMVAEAELMATIG